MTSHTIANENQITMTTTTARSNKKAVAASRRLVQIATVEPSLASQNHSTLMASAAPLGGAMWRSRLLTVMPSSMLLMEDAVSRPEAMDANDISA
jgi:hypothetical protein